MKSILIISHHLPYRNVCHAGGKKIYDFIVHSKKRNVAVYLVSFALPDEVGSLPEMEHLCDGTAFLVSEPVFTEEFLNSFLRSPTAACMQLPVNLKKYWVLRSRLNRKIDRMVRRYAPEVIQVEYSIMALYLRRLQGKALKILHLHDVMIKPLERLYRAEKLILRRFYRWILLQMVRQVEISFCRRFDVLLTASEYDKYFLKKQGDFDPEVFVQASDPVDDVVPFDKREPNSILFVGAMFRSLNEEGVLYFVHEVLPGLKEKLGTVKFYVVGKGPSHKLRSLASDDVLVTDTVNDLEPFYNRCKVSVAPLFIGGGLIFKVVQAMSFGVPVVATTIANEGVSAGQGEEILIADNREVFIRETERLLTDQRLWDSISNRALACAVSRFSWPRTMDNYLAVVGKRLRERSTPVGGDVVERHNRRIGTRA